jgi:hypothetical protein
MRPSGAEATVPTKAESGGSALAEKAAVNNKIAEIGPMAYESPLQRMGILPKRRVTLNGRRRRELLLKSLGRQ